MTIGATLYFFAKGVFMRDFLGLPPLDDREAKLELALIEEFLRAQGNDPAALGALADEERQRLLHDASVYAAGKLAEIEARAHYVEDLHRRE